MEILALVPGAAALDVIHANSDGVVSGVDHWAVAGVSEAAICFTSCTVSPLKLPAHLCRAQTKKRSTGSPVPGSVYSELFLTPRRSLIPRVCLVAAAFARRKRKKKSK